MRIVIEFDAADARAMVTTEADARDASATRGWAAGTLGLAEATDAGPPADGAPLIGQAAVASGEAVDAGPAPDAAGVGAVAGREGVDAGAATRDTRDRHGG